MKPIEVDFRRNLQGGIPSWANHFSPYRTHRWWPDDYFIRNDRRFP